MKKQERTYECCGKIDLTFSKAKRCADCLAKDTFVEVRKSLQQKLEGLYENVQRTGRNDFGQSLWTFTHKECGTEQTWSAPNIQKRLKADPSNTPCKVCGIRRR